MRVEVSPQAAAFVAEHGGSLWVWAERPGLCCNGTPAVMKAHTSPPKDSAGFTTTAVLVHGDPAAGIEVLFRAPGGRYPDVLEVAMHGRRNPKVEAYWDGCLVVM